MVAAVRAQDTNVPFYKRLPPGELEPEEDQAEG